MSSSLKTKLRYKIQYPLRAALDTGRAIVQGKGSKLCRILIASDNLAITSEQQFAPLLTNRAKILGELGIVFEQQLIDDVIASSKVDVKSYAAVFAKLSFLTPTANAMEKIARLRQRFPAPVKLIYFDGDDDSCIQWSGLLDYADLIVKKHIFADLSWYQKQFLGKNNLTDYVSRMHGRSFADNIIPHSGVVPAAQTDKIYLGYNIGLDEKITNLFQTTKPSSPEEKTVDVMCRAACPPDNWIYPLRGPINDALAPLTAKGYKVLVPNARVDQQGYYQEMRSARICISPFGYGELCWRDFETVLMGSLLVKPDMSHVRSEPNIFIPGETYVPCKWDFSDLTEVCERYLSDDAARIAITQRAYEVLSDYYTNDRFLDTLRRALTQAAVPQFANTHFAEARS